MAGGQHLHRRDIPEDAARQALDVLRGRPLGCMVFVGEANPLDSYSDDFSGKNIRVPPI